jgi:putative acetyltransferase
MARPAPESASRAKQKLPANPACVLQELTPQSPDSVILAAKELLLEYGEFVANQPPIATFCYGSLKEEAAALPHSFLDHAGGAMVARVNGKWAGFVAWRPLPASQAAPHLASAWELKRLWIRPEARGYGIGRALVQAVFDRALSAGKSQILLDTSPQSMAAAHRLYLEMGFAECPPYNGPALPGIAYMLKSL